MVTEELLAGGLPVAAHWIMIGGSVPSLLKYGTEGRRRCSLPRIVMEVFSSESG